jgi:hypothetical protein
MESFVVHFTGGWGEVRFVFDYGIRVALSFH